MGMDYGGMDGRDFHLTIDEHRMIYGLLDTADADLKEWSWVNKGDFISEKSCKSWAKLLRSNVGAVTIPKGAELQRPNPLPGTPWQINDPWRLQEGCPGVCRLPRFVRGMQAELGHLH